MKKHISILLAGTVLLASTAACNKRSFNVASESESFRQQASINNKVDIIWVVDGSLTMANHQTNLGENFDAFINQFVAKGFDFRMVVASTDSWVREENYNGGTCTVNPNPTYNPLTTYVSSADCQNTTASFGDLTKFRDGDIYGTTGGIPGARSGNYLITSAMSSSQVIQTFKTNVKTGTRGDGAREATQQSLRAVLRRNADGSVGYGGETHTALANFRRDDAFLAVIVISDEEDQSKKQDGSPYADINEYTQGFLTFLDGYTGSVAGDRNYSVSGIILEDINNCHYGLNAQASQGDKYVAIANATRGTIGNICSTDFSQSLNNISQKIITLASRFSLKREPVPSTLSVVVDGVTIPESDTNGWTYFSDNGHYYVEFHGTGIPPEGAAISVNFTPATLK